MNILKKRWGLLLCSAIACFTISGCNTKDNTPQDKTMVEEMIESDAWNCDLDYCSVNQLINWNTTKYNLNDDVFEILLRTEVDGVYGNAIFKYENDILDVREENGDVYTCTISDLSVCQLTGEQEQQVLTSIEAIKKITDLMN